MNSKNPALTYKNILNGRITQDVIEKSRYYYQIKERLEKFMDIDNILKSKIIIDFDDRLTPGASSKIMAKYILFKTYSDTNVHLCFKSDAKTQNYYAPETFIVQATEYYIKNQFVYEVVNITKTPYTKNEILVFMVYQKYIVNQRILLSIFIIRYPTPVCV